VYQEQHNGFWSDTVEIVGEIAFDLVGGVVSGLLDGLFNL